ncbi:hypothetical protein GCM10027036_03320 [Flavihumibacter cheonanensis]|uniref:hypothetical protein n=1 Tax=Flavihumibacter TaxID=1004301 RepID=UPI001EF8DBA3|nr:MULTISPECIES: hypothetical protein [Flavihumibacter]MCG7752224.1 hypothetical protein [Flavihumibacter cheonanensis]
MVKSKEDLEIQMKYAIAFRKLMNEHRKKWIEGDQSTSVINSYNKLYLEAELRKATLIDIFWGKSNPSAITISKIISALGKTHKEFGELLDGITEDDLVKFKKLLAKKQK